MEHQLPGRLAGQNIHEIFEGQVKQTPDAIALVYLDQRITYGELNRRANRVAHQLRKYEVGKDKLVGLYLERSLDVVVALLGILKAGGAYVPLDPAYPKERLEFILHDSRIGQVVTRESLRPQLSENGLNLVCIDGRTDEEDPALDQNPDNLTNPEDLAYVIYTSGSTGQPKGVMVTHRNVVRLFQSTDDWFGFGPEDVWTMFHSYAFDFSVWEMWGALFYGGRLVVVPQEVTRSPEALYRLVDDEGVTVLCQIPYVFYQLMKVDDQAGGKNLASLRYVIFGGEALNIQRLRNWYGRHDEKHPVLVNMYGITETTVHVTYRPLSAADTADSVGSMIGKSIPDLNLYVLDENMKPLPTGEVGELYVGGAGLARGYLDRPELNRARFVQAPFTDGEERLYRTGDLVRAMADGDMEYIGRQDDQVKIRGFRIELGEVEATMAQHPGVRDAVVIAREIQLEEKQLVAFFTTNGIDFPPVSELRQFLMGKLPAYMVPSRFIRLSELPVTASGKVDRKALREAALDPAWTRDFVPPRTATEETLAKIWVEILGVEKVSIHDNFFELGGHSLLVLRFISRAREAFGIELPLKVIFDQPFLEDIARWIEKAERPVRMGSGPEIPTPPRSDRLPLSYPQENIYFIQQLFPACRAYHGRSLIHFKGDVDVERLEQSLAAMIQRHEIYRTTFHEEDGQTYQVVHPAWTPVLKCTDLRSLLPEERSAELMRRISLDLETSFDLARLPLVHWFLYRTAEDEYTLLFQEHHLVHDGWSFNVFVRDWFEVYRSLSDSSVPALPELLIRFSDFAYDQHKWIRSQLAEDQIAFWKNTLVDAPPALDLPRDHPRPAVEEFIGSNIRIPLPAPIFTSLKKLSREESTTLFMAMLAAFYVLLYKYTGQDDLMVGSGIANRKNKDVENVVGMFINTIVLRARVSPDQSFREFLQEVRKITLDAYDHQEIPFDKVVEAVNPDRNLSQNALFQTMFNFNDAPLQGIRFPGASIRLEEGIDNGSAKVDLNVIVIPRSEQLAGTGNTNSEDTVMLWEYSTALFDRPRIERMVNHYLTLLQSILADPDRQIADLPILEDVDRQQLPMISKSAAQPSPADQSLQKIFADRVLQHPEAIALSAGGEKFTYRELDQRTNQLARVLCSMGLAPAEAVALCTGQSLEAPIGALAVIKAGGAYVPIDPADPVERIASILKDSGARILLTKKSLLSRMQPLAPRVVCLDAPEEYADQSMEDPGMEAGGESLACIYYTSGSAGEPRGVLVPQRAITRLAMGTDRIQIRPSDTFGQGSNPAFSVFSFELWGALLNGAALTVMPHLADFPPPEFATLLQREKITILFLTTPFFNTIARQTPTAFSRLRYLLIGGEQLAAGPVRSVVRNGGPEHLLNVYELTEAGAFACAYSIDDVPEGMTVIPIGTPTANTACHVLDRDRQPAPVGVIGELFIGGDAAALGYMNRPELTAEKFLSNIPGTDPASRWYRTGDLVSRLPDGNLLFHDRLDEQGKIRGFQVDLNEIKASLTSHPGVSDAVVMLQTHQAKDKHLVAFYIPTGDSEPTADELRQFLRGKIPAYMVPADFVRLEEIPLTSNGKIDRLSLARMNITPLARQYVPPKNQVEAALAEIWQRVLHVDRVSMTDNFFELGGHSLLAGVLFAEIRKEFGLNLPLHVLFEDSTVESLAAALINQERAPSFNGIVPIQPEGSGIPFFILSAGLYMRNLALALGTSHPVYGLNPWEDEQSIYRGSVQETVKYYYQCLTNFDSQGPYLLLGHSQYGYYALELARMLRRQGKKVAFLGLLDTYPPGPRPQAAPGDRVKIHQNNLRGKNLFEILEYAARSAQRFATRWWYIAIGIRLIEQNERRGKEEKVKRLVSSAFKLEPYDGRRLFLRAYKPETYDGPVTLFSASERPFYLRQDPMEQWANFFTGRFDVVPIQGDHMSMFEPPLVELLAEKIMDNVRRNESG